jgi:hypothetical protein
VEIPEIPMPEPMPIDGVDEIVAQGYFMINDSRYSTRAAPSISFHPYPGYFHLFPFATWNGVPHFSITNNVEAFFDLLGINSDDVPADRFGNQEVHNVTAVFDNFTQQYFFWADFNIVYAEVTGFLDDWQGDDWQIVHPNFVLVTNGDRTIEPFQVRIGDEFMGLELLRIESSRAYLKNGETYYQLSAEMEVSGLLTLGGDIYIGLRFDSEYRVYVNFAVSSECLSTLPRIADFGENGKTIPIQNTDEVMQAFGVTRRELNDARNFEFLGVEATFEITWVSSWGYVAQFVELREVS